MFPLKVPGETATPFEQGLKGADLDAKMRLIFNFAMKACSQMWKRVKHDGIYPTIMHPVYSKPTDHSESDIDAEHERLHSIFKNGTFKQSSEDTKLLKFLINHCTRSAYKLEFVRCSDRRCSHCSKLPRKETQFVQFLRKHGDRFPDPTLSDVRRATPTHPRQYYTTLRETLHAPASSSAVLDADLPSKNKTIFGQCNNGCRYVFLSAADKKRHRTLMHSKK